MKRIRFATLSVFLTGLCFLNIGCGAGTAKVNGIATLDGKGIDSATILFVGVEGTNHQASVMSAADGTFTLVSNSDPSKGIPHGTYKVVVTKMTSVASDGPAPSIGDKDYMKMMKSLKTNPPKQLLPDKYATIERTPLKVIVPPESSPIKLELTK